MNLGEGRHIQFIAHCNDNQLFMGASHVPAPTLDPQNINFSSLLESQAILVCVSACLSVFFSLDEKIETQRC